MQQRGYEFERFTNEYPESFLEEFTHSDGKTSTIAVGLSHQILQAGFYGVYGSDGLRIREQIFNEKELAGLKGKKSISAGEAQSELTRIVANVAGTSPY